MLARRGFLFSILLSLSAIGPALAPFLGSAALAQDYPSHPVRVVVPFPAGSGPDILARAVGNQLSIQLGQPFVIENRVGANGIVGTKNVIQSPPDGYTLLSSSSAYVYSPYIYKSADYDALRDLTPIATLGIVDGYFMLVNAQQPAKTVADFIALAKSSRVLYGHPGVGNSSHLAAEVFKVAAGVPMEPIPFKGAAEALSSLLADTVQVVFLTPPSAMSLVQDGKLRALGFTGSKPFPPMPQIPLVRATVPEYRIAGSWSAYFAPAGTPQPIVDKLNAEIRKALREPSVVKVAQATGFYPDDRSAADMVAFIRGEAKQAEIEVKLAKIERN